MLIGMCGLASTVIIKASFQFCRKYDKLLDEFSSPKEGTQALKFKSKYPKPFWVQYQTVFTKYTAAYWRMPEYNGMRFFYAISVGFLFGAIFWRLG